MRVAVAALLVAAGCQCQQLPGVDGGGSGGGGGGDAQPLPVPQCVANFERVKVDGEGPMRIAQMRSATDGVAGPNSQGHAGDWVLENAKLRVVVQGFDRHIGALPFGGNLIDLDFAGDAGVGDQFGEVGLLYNFGRTLKPTRFDVLGDGLDGGALVLAVTGDDSPNDYLSIRSQLVNQLGSAPLTDPFVEVPMRITQYYVLNPDEPRVRIVTAFCNLDKTKEVVLSVGDLFDPGYVLEFFNGKSCTGGFGYAGICFGLNRMSWFGFQGAGVAYGYAPNKINASAQPEVQNALLSLAGTSGVLIGAPGVTGIASWFGVDAGFAEHREGELRIPAAGVGTISRDFWVAPDLGQLSNQIEAARAQLTGASFAQATGTVRSSGTPLGQARVVFQSHSGAGNTVFMTDAAGRFSAQLPAGTYEVSASALGRQPSSKQTVTLSGATPVELSFDLVGPRVLNVTAREVGGAPMPAKVTVLCARGVCPVPFSSRVLYQDTNDVVPDSVALIDFVGANGSGAFRLPPDEYFVLVSRGPEYSVYPPSFPSARGAYVDLRNSDASLDAVLARVIDSTGYMSVDTHVHSVNSVDSVVANDERVLGFAADGMDIIVSTDHDVVTDFAPHIARMGLGAFLAQVIGLEASPGDFGHYNFFPISYDATDSVTHGAIDWAGADGPTFSVAELFAEGRRRSVKTIQLNHPRGFLGGLTHLLADTDTWATHADPATFRMAVQEGSSAGDSKLISTDFDALEVLNNSEDQLDPASPVSHARFNDWFTLLSRGVVVTATGVTDTHYRSRTSGWRTYVELGIDAPADFSSDLFSQKLNAHRAFITSGPFVKMTGYRLNSSGAQVTPEVSVGDTLGPAGGDLVVDVDVQLPEGMGLTKVELYMHQPQDDSACPHNPSNPNAATTRVACNGAMNINWPASGIAASQLVGLTPSDLETAASESGVDYRRYHKRVHFRLSPPTTDNWVVAFVYGDGSVAPHTQHAGAKPFALTNPIFIDADGNGYDHPPFNPSAMRRSRAAQAPPPLPAPPRDEAEFMLRWEPILAHE